MYFPWENQEIETFAFYYPLFPSEMCLCCLHKETWIDWRKGRINPSALLWWEKLPGTALCPRYIEYEKRSGITRKQEGSVATSHEFISVLWYLLLYFIPLHLWKWWHLKWWSPMLGNHAAERSPGVCALLLCCKLSFGTLLGHFLGEIKS